VRQGLLEPVVVPLELDLSKETTMVLTDVGLMVVLAVLAVAFVAVVLGTLRRTPRRQR
jgi:hypothetical protein